MADRLYDSLQVRQHLLIGEAQNPKPFGDKESIAMPICRLSFFEIMGLTIKLDDELCREAREVSDVVLDRNLPAKANTIYSIGFEVTP